VVREALRKKGLVWGAVNLRRWQPADRMRYVDAARFLGSLPRSISRIAALDVGTRHVGVAVSDENRIVSSPLTTIERSVTARNSAAAVGAFAEKLQSVLTEAQVDGLVVGLPLFQGKPTPLCEEIIQLMLRAQCHSSDRARQDVVFTLWNENSSTMESRRLSKALGARDGAFRKHKDSLAAVVILRSFLEAHSPALKTVF